MATFEFVGGLTADLFNDIDDPFSGSTPLHDIRNTLEEALPPPEGDLPVQQAAALHDDVSSHDEGAPHVVADGMRHEMSFPEASEACAESDWPHAPVLSRPSGLITLPLPLFAADEQRARHRSGWSERALILGLSTIIVAASVTAAREHARDPRVGVWVTRGSTLWSALWTSESSFVADPSQRPRRPAAPPRKPVTAIKPSRTGAPIMAQRPQVPQVVRVYPSPVQSPAVPPAGAAQAASPQQLPEVVFASRSHVRVNASERPHASPVRVQKPRIRAPQDSGNARGALAGVARAEAREHYAARRYPQAVSAYEQAAKLDPSFALTFAGLGAARLQLGNSRGAIQAYERAAHLSPSSVAVHVGLAHAYLREGNTRRARASCERALAIDPTNAAAKAALSRL